jgi:hypothetical protein
MPLALYSAGNSTTRGLPSLSISIPLLEYTPEFSDKAISRFGMERLLEG